MNPRHTRSRTLRDMKRRGPLLAVAAAGLMLLGIGVPAYAQFFPFGGPPRPPRPVQQAPQPYNGGGYNGGGYGGGFGGWGGGGGFFGQEAPRPPPQVDYSHAPRPEKNDNVPERYVLVLGDSMADWLAYGLEDAFKEQPDMGVTRKHKTVSGLIKYQPKGEPSDWVAAAKQIVPAEKADAIVVMLGLQDRTSIRETAQDTKQDPKAAADKKKADAAKSDAAKPGDAAKNDNKTDAAKPDAEKKADDQQAADDADTGDTPQIIVPEKGAARNASGIYEFRDDRWVELYNKKIDDMIAVLKTKGVPIVWVGLPAVRGPKATADMLFLDSLYREAANKAGITYVDVWDGFVDEGGRFMQRGPDFEGQPRKLRSDDGVYFTTAGARKLAHYVDREIERLLANRSIAVAIPNEPAQPDVARPGAPAPRPLAGPIVPLTAAAVESDALLGGPGSRPAQTDPLAQRTLVKGEALPQLAGRADDAAWPRREVGRVDPGKDVPTASATSDGRLPAGVQQGALPPGTLPQQQKKRPALTQNPGFFPFFRRPLQPQLQPPQQAHPPQPPGSPQPIRPPGYINRAASVPSGTIAR